MKFFCIIFSFIFLSFENVYSKSLNKIDINLIQLVNDPFYLDKKGYTGILIDKKFPPNRAIKMAIKENKFNLDMLGIDLRIKVIWYNNELDFNDFKRDSILLLDLPDPIIKEIIYKIPNNLLLINARSNDNDFRKDLCKENFFHVIPSNKMYTDAIAQYLIEKNWKKVLVIHGPNEKDLAKYNSFFLSSRKFNLDIIETRKFTLSKNPKDRKKNNYKLISTGDKFNVIVIFDDFGEFSRKLPYSTLKPHLIFGDSGLSPKAWHWSWERNGGPQLNKRFKRDNFEIKGETKDRNMNDNDWAAWASVKLIVEALKVKNSKKIVFLDSFLDKNLSIDIYKGKTGSFRLWNNQLRQPILMTTHNAVIMKMPSEKFMHKKILEDTLGFDKNESNCNIR
jgi:ABC transporter substrate binding protein (PQQ-dependent alcohol dehydrogenase system)